MGISGGNRVVAFSGFIGTIGYDTANVMIERDLIKQFRQRGRVTDVAGGDLGGPDLQGFLVDA